MSKRRPYVGRRKSDNKFVLFTTKLRPTENDFPEYNYVIGPFQTHAGARFMRDYGDGNPHCRCVADAERLAKQSAADLVSP